MILVPRPSCSVSVSSEMEKVPPALDSQMYCSSSVVLRDDGDLVSDEVGRVETDTELANH